MFTMTITGSIFGPWKYPKPHQIWKQKIRTYIKQCEVVTLPDGKEITTCDLSWDRIAQLAIKFEDDMACNFYSMDEPKKRKHKK